MKASSPTGQDRIFISYRSREDGFVAKRLYERLTDHFYSDQVFFAPRGIELAENFVIAINNALRSCRVLLALIGGHWHTIADANWQAPDDPQDFVRMEIETALAQPNVKVIPILVDGAKIPPAYELPGRMAKLPQLEALKLSLDHFDIDLDRLIQKLYKIIPRRVLVVGPIALSIPLFILALRFAGAPLHMHWFWLVLVSAVLGATVATVDYRRSMIWLVAIETALIWCIVFAIYKLDIWHIRSLLPWNQGIWSASSGARFLAILTGTAAIINVSLLLALAQRFRKKKRAVHALLPVFLGCMAAGLGIKTLGFVLNTTFRAIGWIFLAALLANLFAPLVALRRKLSGSWDSPSAVRAPSPGGGAATRPMRTG